MCESPLCDLQVLKEGRIEDSGRSTLQVDFANQKLGGGALHHARVQVNQGTVTPTYFS